MVPAMTLDEQIREICDRLAQDLRDVYQRGESEGIARLVRVAQSRSIEAPLDAADRAVAVREPRISERKRRAPKGAVSALVNRVLEETEGPTVAEIKDRAADDIERSIAASSIRAHLRGGRDLGRYVERHGRWYRTEPEHESDEAANPAGGRAASDLWSDQEDHR